MKYYKKREERGVKNDIRNNKIDENECKDTNR